MNTLRIGELERRDLIIHLLNPEHESVLSWRVRSAWPSRLAGPELDAMSGTVAFEAMEVVYEGVRVVGGP
ncbi:MAG: phage tail protein [Gemmatimonadales bacterium]|nr:MAG: phage tail protein [Gemmatimonadales bacterium]